MKYITPNVPNIKITTKEGKEVLIDYVCETEIVTLNKKALILIEVPLSDTNMDELNHTDTYKMNLNFKTVDTMCKDLESKELNFENMELKLKLDTYMTGCTERKIYAFYNSEGDNIYDVITSMIKYKYYQQKDETKLKMRIKYFEEATKLQKIQKGNWIDVYANKDIFVPVGERAMIPLGFALELPQGWEGHLAPRSSTFKTWGVIQTNHVGVVDDTYIGDNDQWHMPVYCLQDKCFKSEEDKIQGVWIRQGDKIGQFRIMEVMPEIEFEEVDTFGNVDRGGFGTTSSR